MALFFFHFIEDGIRSEDEIGLDLPSAEQAYLEAMAAARGMLAELIVRRADPMHCAFEIANAQGAILFSVEFAELFRAAVRAPEAHSETIVLVSMIENTHRRVTAARNGVAESMTAVRQSISQSHQLLAQLGTFGL